MLKKYKLSSYGPQRKENIANLPYQQVNSPDLHIILGGKMMQSCFINKEQEINKKTINIFPPQVFKYILLKLFEKPLHPIF